MTMMMDQEEECFHMKLGEGYYLRNAGGRFLEVVHRMRRKEGISWQEIYGFINRKFSITIHKTSLIT
jgi:hypothetical protein